ncbi:hypothetical protein D3C80_1919520 [compost metagenome]
MTKFIENKTKAAINPPVKLVSGPTIAFWTELLINKIRIISAVFNCESSFLPNTRKAIVMKK